MTQHGKPIEVLSEAECWQLLATQPVGRIVTRVRDVMDVVPINFVVDDGTIVFRTAAGNKLAELAVNPAVLFEVDSVGAEQGWSVVVRGNAEIISREADVYAAEQLGLRTYVDSSKPTFVRVLPESVSGRSFAFKTEAGEE